MKLILLLVFLLTFNIQGAFAYHLGDLQPGADHSIVFEVMLNHHVTPNEVHYAILEDSNFGNSPIFIRTTDNRRLNHQETPIETSFKNTGYDLVLSCSSDAPSGDYHFTIHTYARNPQNGSIYKNSIQHIRYTFRIISNLSLREIPLWNPPPSGKPWESKVVSRHTIRVTSNEDWQLSLQGIKGSEGLHAVLIEKNPEVYR